MARYDGTFGGVFAGHVNEVWKHTYEVTLRFQDIAGGVPSDPKVAEGWIKSKIKDASKEDRIRQAVQQMMAERNISEAQAVEELNKHRNVNGFWRDPATGQLYIEGRQVKAALKEGVSVAVAAGNLEARKWGKTNKGAISYAAEHIQVMTGQVLLYHEDWSAVKEPTRVLQTFPVNPITKQTGIQYTELCEHVLTKFVVATDCDDFTEKVWATIFLTGGLQGLGASRSQDRGRYEVIEWKEQAPA